MLLAFDVGNSNIVLGVFKDRELLTNWRIETDTNKSADEYGMVVNQLFQFEGLKMEDIDDIIISTVVPSVLFTLQHLSMKYFNKRAIVVESGVKTGLVVKYDNPKQVGADRIVNAVAAFHKYGGPLIILDFGTATTFCAVTNCPIASILLGVELFGAEPLLLYLLVCAVSYLLSGHYSLYSSQMTLGPKLTNPPPEKPVDSFCH